MPHIEFNTHISGSFNRELQDLRNAVLVMGGDIEQQLLNTLKAMQFNDASLAEKVVLNDVKINGLEIEIDQECLRIKVTSLQKLKGHQFDIQVIQYFHYFIVPSVAAVSQHYMARYCQQHHIIITTTFFLS